LLLQKVAEQLGWRHWNGFGNWICLCVAVVELFGNIVFVLVISGVFGSVFARSERVSERGKGEY
jgi:hypothetical protein